MMTIKIKSEMIKSEEESSDMMSDDTSSITSLMKPLAMPLYDTNANKFVGIYTPEVFDNYDFVDFALFEGKSLKLSLSDNRQEDTFQWDNFLMDSRNADETNNLLSESDIHNCSSNSIKDPSLSSNRIVDLFGVTTTRTLKDIKIYTESSTPKQLSDYTMIKSESETKPTKRFKPSPKSSNTQNTSLLIKTESFDSTSTSTSTSMNVISEEGPVMVSVVNSRKKSCQSEGCGRYSQGNTHFCIAHGGGRRCTVENCTKSARGPLFCSAHGGGKRCTEPGCKNGAVGGASSKCVTHGGGGKRCRVGGCGRALHSGSQFCSKHHNEDQNNTVIAS